MSFKKSVPYELKKDSNVKTRRNDSRLDRLPGTSGISKREVSPQFSEPDEYRFTSTPQNSFQQGTHRYEQLKQNFTAPWCNPQGLIVETSENARVPLYQPLPTFRQYLQENNANVQTVQKHNTKFVMSGSQSNSKASTTVMKNSLEEASGTKSRENKNKKFLIGTRIRHMIGVVDQVIRWYKMAKQSELELHYEVAGILESTVRKECSQLLVIRSESGHVMQGVFYTIDRELPIFPKGTIITATGNMIGSNKMHVFDMNSISKDDFLSVQRLAFLSQRALEEAL